MLTWLIALPVIGAAIVALVPGRLKELHLPLGVALAVLPLALAGYVFWVFEPIAEYQFVQEAVWYEPWGISWSLGIDGVSMPMVLLTAILVPIALAASTSITRRTKEFVVYTLLLEAGMIGVFLALDLFLFFVFFEAILIPMYFIIGIWGSDRRIYSAMKFFIFTAFGSAVLLAGIIALAVTYADQFGSASFALSDLMNVQLSTSAERWLFVAFALAFAIKVPLFPVHTWLPDAHTEAPTAGSVLLAAVLLKLGTYGLLRFNLSLFPEASVDAAWIMGTLAVIGIIYGAVVAIVQPDLKRLIAYSSVSHLGFCVLGLFALNPLGLQGSVLYMINHGLSTGALFFLVGMIYERYHTREMSKLGGLAKRMPVWAFFMVFFVLASVGLPGLNGFISEFLCLIGAFTASADNAAYPGVLGPWYAAAAALGMIFAAMYLLIMTGRVVFGALKEPAAHDNDHGAKLPADLTFREIGVLAPLAALCLYIGFQPKPLTDALQGPITQVLAVYPQTVRQHLAENASAIDELDRVILTMTETDSDRNKGADDG